LISLLTHDSAAFIETLEIFLKWQYIAAFFTPAKTCRSQYFLIPYVNQLLSDFYYQM
jgi:hypothetical protein